LDSVTACDSFSRHSGKQIKARIRQTFKRRETRHAGKFLLQVLRQPFHHLLAVAFGLLRLDNDSTDVPIKQNQLAVDRNHRAKLRRADTRLEVGEERGVTSGKRAGQFASLSAGFCQLCGCCLSFRHTKCLPAVLPTTILNRFRKLRA
jgi:hypothetical protein